MQLFFTSQTDGNNAFLDAEETRHLKVLRKNVGDAIQVIDGKGLLLDCVISRIGKDSTDLDIKKQARQQRPRKYYFHLYVAPTKQNERMEWMLEKAVEAGLDEITFLETEHSEKTRINMGRLQKIAVSAIKQSGQYYLPLIHPLIKLDQVPVDDHTFIAYCGVAEKAGLKDAILPLKENAVISILIGPEGDFSEKEANDMMHKGARGISLGNSRLRTETAALYCAIMLDNLE
jgi:16S rRNA (uracil1498-N3)-methyltransferase